MKVDIFKNIGLSVSSAIGKTGLKLQKVSPEILVAIGVIGVVGSGVMACKATLKLEDSIKGAREDIQKAVSDERVPEDEPYRRKDIAHAYFNFGKEIVKLYGPSLTLGALSIASIIYGHDISRRRNVALMAAYAGLERTFNNYRSRVISQIGEEAEERIRTGIEKKEIEKTYTDEKGKEKTKKEVVDAIDDPNSISSYSRIYDSGCKGWEKNPEYNLMFLRGQQSYFNDLLKIRGHVFLNEVYDALGFPRTSQGSVVGWVLGAGDDYIDFGLYDIHSAQARNFVNGYEPTVLLDFNVDGVIFDKI